MTPPVELEQLPLGPLHRRRGCARAALRVLLARAGGEQIDEQDGLEIVHERPA